MSANLRITASSSVDFDVFTPLSDATALPRKRKAITDGRCGGQADFLGELFKRLQKGEHVFDQAPLVSSEHSSQFIISCISTQCSFLLQKVLEHII